MPAAPASGSVVLRGFELGDALHSGPGGHVFAAQGPVHGPVVVKLAPGGEGAARIAHEAQVLERLSDPRVGALLDHGALPGGGHALVLGVVRGRTLGEVLATRRIPLPVALGWAQQICTALAHCHDHGIVHRDVKAANVLVDGDDASANLVLIDFGIASVQGEGESPRRGAGLLGSVHTVSPEMVRGDAVDARADLYAVGVLLFRMLAGRYPYHAANPAEVVAAHLHKEVPALGAHRPELRLPPGLEDLVVRCLSKAPSARPGSAAELADQLAVLARIPEAQWVKATGFDITLVPPEHEDELPALVSPGRYVAAAVVAAVVVAVGAGVLLI